MVASRKQNRRVEYADGSHVGKSRPWSSFTVYLMPSSQQPVRLVDSMRVLICTCILALLILLNAIFALFAPDSCPCELLYSPISPIIYGQKTHTPRSVLLLQAWSPAP